MSDPTSKTGDLPSPNVSVEPTGQGASSPIVTPVPPPIPKRPLPPPPPPTSTADLESVIKSDPPTPRARLSEDPHQIAHGYYREKPVGEGHVYIYQDGPSSKKGQFRLGILEGVDVVDIILADDIKGTSLTKGENPRLLIHQAGAKPQRVGTLYRTKNGWILNEESARIYLDKKNGGKAESAKTQRTVDETEEGLEEITEFEPLPALNPVGSNKFRLGYAKIQVDFELNGKNLKLLDKPNGKRNWAVVYQYASSSEPPVRVPYVGNEISLEDLPLDPSDSLVHGLYQFEIVLVPNVNKFTTDKLPYPGSARIYVEDATVKEPLVVGYLNYFQKKWNIHPVIPQKLNREKRNGKPLNSFENYRGLHGQKLDHVETILGLGGKAPKVRFDGKVLQHIPKNPFEAFEPSEMRLYLPKPTEDVTETDVTESVDVALPVVAPQVVPPPLPRRATVPPPRPVSGIVAEVGGVLPPTHAQVDAHNLQVLTQAIVGEDKGSLATRSGYPLTLPAKHFFFMKFKLDTHGQIQSPQILWSNNWATVGNPLGLPELEFGVDEFGGVFFKPETLLAYSILGDLHKPQGKLEPGQQRVLKAMEPNPALIRSLSARWPHALDALSGRDLGLAAMELEQELDEIGEGIGQGKKWASLKDGEIGSLVFCVFRNSQIHILSSNQMEGAEKIARLGLNFKKHVNQGQEGFEVSFKLIPSDLDDVMGDELFHLVSHQIENWVSYHQGKIGNKSIILADPLGEIKNKKPSVPPPPVPEAVPEPALSLTAYNELQRDAAIKVYLLIFGLVDKNKKGGSLKIDTKTGNIFSNGRNPNHLELEWVLRDSRMEWTKESQQKIVQLLGDNVDFTAQEAVLNGIQKIPNSDDTVFSHNLKTLAIKSSGLEPKHWPRTDAPLFNFYQATLLLNEDGKITQVLPVRPSFTKPSGTGDILQPSGTNLEVFIYQPRKDELGIVKIISDVPLNPQQYAEVNHLLVSARGVRSEMQASWPYALEALQGKGYGQVAEQFLDHLNDQVSLIKTPTEPLYYKFDLLVDYKGDFIIKANYDEGDEQYQTFLGSFTIGILPRAKGEKYGITIGPSRKLAELSEEKEIQKDTKKQKITLIGEEILELLWIQLHQWLEKTNIQNWKILEPPGDLKDETGQAHFVPEKIKNTLLDDPDFSVQATHVGISVPPDRGVPELVAIPAPQVQGPTEDEIKNRMGKMKFILGPNTDAKPRGGILGLPRPRDDYGTNFAMTHPGVGYKSKNEDGVVMGRNFLILLDGMGGHAHGEDASREAGMAMARGIAMDKDLQEAMKMAHQEVIQFNEGKKETEGRGDAGTVAVGYQVKGNKLQIVHAGDATAMVLRKDAGGYYQVVHRTRPHTTFHVAAEVGGKEVDELKYRSSGATILSALGVGKPAIDTADWYLQPGDVVLLATDGLTNNLSTEEQMEIIAGRPDVKQAVNNLYQQAIEKMQRLQTAKALLAKVHEPLVDANFTTQSFGPIRVASVDGHFIDKDGRVFDARGNFVDVYKADNLSIALYWHNVAGYQGTLEGKVEKKPTKTREPLTEPVQAERVESTVVAVVETISERTHNNNLSQVLGYVHPAEVESWRLNPFKKRESSINIFINPSGRIVAVERTIDSTYKPKPNALRIHANLAENYSIEIPHEISGTELQKQALNKLVWDLNKLVPSMSTLKNNSKKSQKILAAYKPLAEPVNFVHPSLNTPTRRGLLEKLMQGLHRVALVLDKDGKITKVCDQTLGQTRHMLGRHAVKKDHIVIPAVIGPDGALMWYDQAFEGTTQQIRSMAALWVALAKERDVFSSQHLIATKLAISKHPDFKPDGNPFTDRDLLLTGDLMDLLFALAKTKRPVLEVYLFEDEAGFVRASEEASAIGPLNLRTGRDAHGLPQGNIAWSIDSTNLNGMVKLGDDIITYYRQELAELKKNAKGSFPPSVHGDPPWAREAVVIDLSDGHETILPIGEPPLRAEPVIKPESRPDPIDAAYLDMLVEAAPAAENGAESVKPPVKKPRAKSLLHRVGEVLHVLKPTTIIIDPGTSGDNSEDPKAMGGLNIFSTEGGLARKLELGPQHQQGNGILRMIAPKPSADTAGQKTTPTRPLAPSSFMNRLNPALRSPWKSARIFLKR